MRPNEAVIRPQIMYPTEMKTLRLLSLSLSVPITKVVITAVAALSPTIRLIAEVYGIAEFTAA